MANEDDLIYYLEQSKQAIDYLSAKSKVTIEPLKFQIALGDKLGYQDRKSHYVVTNRLSASEMISLLESHDFTPPELIATYVSSYSILPLGVPGALNEETIKVNGEIWRIHKNDPDPFPSNPHAHNIQTGYKIHLGTGDLFDRRNKFMNARISKKDLIAIRDKVKNIALPILAV